MRSFRPALLSSVLLVTILPAPTLAAGAATDAASAAAPTASAEVIAAGSGTDLITDVTGYFVAGGAGASYTPIAPVRLLDTRAAVGLSGRFVSGTVRGVQIAGRGGVPDGVEAVTVNVTVIQPTSSGYVSVGPEVTASPKTSTINVPRGDTRANGTTVALDAEGRLEAVFKGAGGARTHLLMDVTGYFVAGEGSRFVPVDPVRIADSRVPSGIAGSLQDGVPRAIPVVGDVVPSQATAVVLNVTVTGQGSSGYVTVGPEVDPSPDFSTLNIPRGDTRANGTTVALDDQGRVIAVFDGASGARAHIIVDVLGYYVPGDEGATYFPRTPVRLLDTRVGVGLSHLFASGVPRAVQVTGRGGVHEQAVAVTANVTMVDQSSLGYVSVGPEVDSSPETSTLNAPLGDVRANGVTVALDGEGRLRGVFKGQRGPNYPSYDSRYHNEWEMIVAIRDAEVAYPDIVDVFPVGKSYQGRTIWAAKVSDNVAKDENEPEVLLDALHHAREHLTIEQILDTFDQLTSRYGENTRITDIVNRREVWFIFALNPDGWAFDLTGSPYRGWRKNRQPNSNGTVGTDLNRNYDYRWGCCGGSSGSPGAWNYRGTSPFSTPEARVIRDFVNGRVVGGEQQITTAISFHTNGELILWPYGYTYTNVPSDMRTNDHRVFVALARGMASRNGYVAQQSSDLYKTDGDFIDWMYGRHRIFALTVELYPDETVAKPTDHEPPDEVIAPQNERNRSAMLFFLEQSGCPYQLIGGSC